MHYWNNKLSKPLLAKLVIGNTKGFIRGKALSVEGHTHSYAPVSHKHSATDITSGVLSPERGGTGVTSIEDLADLIKPHVGQTVSAKTIKFSSVSDNISLTRTGNPYIIESIPFDIIASSFTVNLLELTKMQWDSNASNPTEVLISIGKHEVNAPGRLALQRLSQYDTRRAEIELYLQPEYVALQIRYTVTNEYDFPIRDAIFSGNIIITAKS